MVDSGNGLNKLGLPVLACLPCPFCGVNDCATIEHYEDDDYERKELEYRYAYVWCLECLCIGPPGMGATRLGAAIEAIEYWNRRPEGSIDQV